jgi:acetyltransferase-like isoleucine patch superfamily enzyme
VAEGIRVSVSFLSMLTRARARPGTLVRTLARARSRSFQAALKIYLANHLVAAVPSFRVRHWYYRRVLGYALGRDSSIHMNTFVTGDFITVGDNVVINRRCYLDGRIGIEIGNNVSISPEAYIVSMEHDPDSPVFATRGGKVVIADHVWVGARTLIMPGVTIGEGAVVGAGAVVTKSIAPYRIAVGVPAREIRDRPRDIRYACHYFPWFDTDIQRE